MDHQQRARQPCRTLTIALFLCITSTAFALDFLALTGRVVDQANVMSAASRSAIKAKSTLGDGSIAGCAFLLFKLFGENWAGRINVAQFAL